VAKRLGSGPEQLRRPGDDLRHADDVGHRAAHRGAGEFRHRAVPDRAVAGLAEAAAGTAIELLAAVPSIVYGMWGLLVFGPIWPPMSSSRCRPLPGVPVLGALVAGPPVGIGILSAGIILAIMIIPFIASVMRDVFEVTPPMLKESAYGLGSTTWEVVSNVVLPYTKAGVVGGIMLGLGRALGETMAVTFVIGNMNQLRFTVAVRGGQQHHIGARQ
jgi:ABC-type phosphate transport system permease subunit